MAASHDGDADFGTDAPLEGENTKRNDLWKLDHVIALISVSYTHLTLPTNREV